MSTEIIVAIIGGASLIITGIIAYIKDMQVKKIEIENKNLIHKLNHAEESQIQANLKINILDKLANLTIFSEIRGSARSLFENTKADRFLMLFAINGKTELRTVSVIFEEYKSSELDINAIVRYRDIQIDDEYRRLLKNAESNGSVMLETKTMPSQLLKNFYTIEQVEYSMISFIERKALDDDNDMVIYCSVATHTDEEFTKLEQTIIKTEIESQISRVVRQYL